LTLEPLDLAVLTLAPSVVFCGFGDLLREEKATRTSCRPETVWPHSCVPLLPREAAQPGCGQTFC
jgi:hypothetical protein